jgi:hypothetical protein
MIIPKDATPTRGEPDAFYTPLVTPKTLDSPGSAFRRVPQAGTRRALRRQLVKAVDARRGKESRANGLLRELLSELRELDGIGSPEPCTPFSPKRMNLRGAVRVPLPPSEIDRVGAEVAALSRGGLSRRDVGVALVVAGLGALTLAATTVVGA